MTKTLLQIETELASLIASVGRVADTGEGMPADLVADLARILCDMHATVRDARIKAGCLREDRPRPPLRLIGNNAC